MPVYKPQHVEYTIVNGRVAIVGDDGTSIPAYWSHPDIGGKFPAIAIVHDWWGITDTERRIAHLFAQLGYYVVVPDLFNGNTATTPEQAMALVKQFGTRAYRYVEIALDALERHLRCTGDTAVVGFGMGGTLAYEAAVTCDDIEAAVSYYGFPQRFFGKFEGCKVPILAFYGESDPHVKSDIVAKLRTELALSPHPHDVVMLPNTGRDFMDQTHAPHERAVANQVWERTLKFIEDRIGTRQQ